MTILDRYLLRQFFRVFAMIFISLLGVFIIGDFVGNLSKFVDSNSDGSGIGRTLGTYYGARVPWFFDLAGRNVAVLSAVMTVAWLQKQNEFTALMAAGISRWRTVRPLILACAVVAILAVLNREYGIPNFREQLCRSARDLIHGHPERVTPRYDNETDVLIDGKAIYQLEQRIEAPNFRLPVEWPGVGRSLTAENAYFLEGEGDRPSGYRMRARDLPQPASQLASLIAEDQALVLTPRDYPHWIPADEVLVVSKLGIQQLTRGRKWRQYTATAPLVGRLRDGQFDSHSDVGVLIHARFVQPILDMTLLFLGLPMVLDGSSKIVWSAAKSLIALTVFALVVIVSHGLGMHGLLSPAMAAWAPAFVLIPAAFMLSEPLRT